LRRQSLLPCQNLHRRVGRFAAIIARDHYPSRDRDISLSIAIVMPHRPAETEPSMSATADDLSKLVPTAKEVMQKVAMAEAEKATAEMRKNEKAEAEKKALIDKLSKPSGRTDEDVLKQVANIIQRAVKNGVTEVQVYRFPNVLLTDNGRAINQQESGWEKTLTGVPKEIYEFWQRHLRERGYKLRFQIIEFPGGVPGDVGVTLKWG
jgi:hypothetical protein